MEGQKETEKQGSKIQEEDISWVGGVTTGTGWLESSTCELGYREKNIPLVTVVVGGLAKCVCVVIAGDYDNHGGLGLQRLPGGKRNLAKDVSWSWSYDCDEVVDSI
ncbi:hypothetical protein L1887_12600 [Cichorium endivia]|nr:hypothetical protein L1887_12600 [Cichorium endivia]